ncbi:MAG: type II toxin-antitoxin system HicA family toxin [Desulfurispora sp.]|uniref:type II toxin-antitoxin system HicA family toxin n=1 Tax=Desulfurispora sp. TaxID=3014275 RepID=UPI00404A46E2
MTPRLPRVSGKDILAALKRNGFTLVDIEGSHHYLLSPAGKIVTIPVHGQRILKPKTLKSILNQAGLTAEELIDLL